MLTYTFTKREKVLLVVLACILVLVAWYVFVYQNVNSQIVQLDNQIADTQSQVTIDSAKLQKMNTMQQAIDAKKAAGTKPVTLPAYDNIQPLMASLNTTLASTDNYSLKFDNLDWSSSGTVQRGVTLTFGCASYDAAKAIAKSIEQGTYPCIIDTISFVDNTATRTSGYSNVGSGSSSSSSTSSYGATIHVTYYEKAS